MVKLDKKIFNSEMSLVKWWQGTDALKLAIYPPGSRLWHVRIFFERIFWKVFHRFFIHLVNSEKLLPYLHDFGIYDVQVQEVPWCNKWLNYVERVEHDGFNVLYYMPTDSKNQRYKDWVYGRNFWYSIVDEYLLNSGICLEVVDGSRDMAKVLPIIDLYVKYNAHKGSDKNRLAKECEYLGIPVFYTDYTKSNADNLAELKKFLTREV